MDIWFWLAAGFIAVVFGLSAISAYRDGGWRELGGSIVVQIAPFLVLAAVFGLLLLIVLATGGNDGWLLALGLPVLVGIVGFIAWRFRH